MNIAVFTYNFPHKKTQDFLLRLSTFKHKPKVVFACPPKRLDLPKSLLKDKHEHLDLIQPKILCDLLGIRYMEIPHNDGKVASIIKNSKIDMGIIAGARILEDSLIDSIPNGIINFHPGLIPENRGLNAVKWAIYLDLPQGMTVHKIDEKIDAGTLYKRFIIPVYQEDTLKDINLRVYESQVVELIPIIEDISKEKAEPFKAPFNVKKHPPADSVIDKVVLKSFEDYKKKWAFDLNGWLCRCRNNLEFIDNKSICKSCKRKYEKRHDKIQHVQ